MVNKKQIYLFTCITLVAKIWTLNLITLDVLTQSLEQNPNTF